MPSQLFQAIIYIYIYIFKKQSGGFHSDSLDVESPIQGLHSSLLPDFSSSPFIFLWLFTAVTEKREGLL